MKTKLLKLEQISGPQATFYTILSDNGKATFMEFLEEYKASFEQDILSIVTRLRLMGQKLGATENFFKTDEGTEVGDLVCALYDIPDKHLRLYCVRISEKIVVLGNGGPKTVRAWQEDERLTKEVELMMHYSAIIRKKLETGDLKISEDGLTFEGKQLLTEN